MAGSHSFEPVPLERPPQVQVEDHGETRSDKLLAQTEDDIVRNPVGINRIASSHTTRCLNGLAHHVGGQEGQADVGCQSPRRSGLARSGHTANCDHGRGLRRIAAHGRRTRSCCPRYPIKGQQIVNGASRARLPDPSGTRPRGT